MVITIDTNTLEGQPMRSALKTFGKADDGAITVDWVVLCAAVIGLGMVVLIPIAFGANSATQGVADYIGNITVGYDNN